MNAEEGALDAEEIGKSGAIRQYQNYQRKDDRVFLVSGPNLDTKKCGRGWKEDEAVKFKTGNGQIWVPEPQPGLGRRIVST